MLFCKTFQWFSILLSIKAKFLQWTERFYTICNVSAPSLPTKTAEEENNDFLEFFSYFIPQLHCSHQAANFVWACQTGSYLRAFKLGSLAWNVILPDIAMLTFSFQILLQFSSVQSLSHVQFFVTPWIAVHQASLSITNSRSSLRLMSIESVMPSSHLILCHPLLLLPPIPPSIRVFSNESTLLMRWPKSWSFSFSIIPSKEIPGLISLIRPFQWVLPRLSNSNANFILALTILLYLLHLIPHYVSS